MTEASIQPLLSVRNLKKHFTMRASIFDRRPAILRAVDGVSFDIAPGETLGLVGESGCGKSTTGRTILRLDEPTSGEIVFEGRDIRQFDRHQLRSARRQLQIVFQDPYSSLDPRKTVGATVAEPLKIHNLAPNRREREDRVVELLETVGLSRDHLGRYPHEFSGGQRQRIGIARALAVSPKLIICDEPVSALDVSVQAQVINLLQDLQEKFALTYLFIAHDLSVVEHISNRVAVMYLGKIVEIAPAQELYTNPVHPYAEALLSAVPTPDPKVKREKIVLTGDVASVADVSRGCRFYQRCPLRQPSCATTKQVLTPVSPGHFVACQVRTGVSGESDDQDDEDGVDTSNGRS